MIVSMTGFAAQKGAGLGHVWTWDLRSVNGKGLDVRLRVPDWIEGLEHAIRAEIAKYLSRGSVSLTLKLTRETAGDGVDAPVVNSVVNHAVLTSVLNALSVVEKAAMAANVTLAQATCADILGFRGVIETASVDMDQNAIRALMLGQLPALLAEFQAVRHAEGRALGAIVTAQLDRINDLVRDATDEAKARKPQAEKMLREAMQRVMAQVAGIDETRLAQELALIAVKNDVTEELDRLGAHVEAARALVSNPGPTGRKFDFLMQEFLREANTLCSKSQSLALTRIGLDLKTVIDQMREQVQNVE